MENIGIGLLLMVVGMATVFVILLIVIWIGQLLIRSVNRFAPEEISQKKPVSATATVDAGEIDAIKAAVDVLTSGKGQIMKIEKLQ